MNLQQSLPTTAVLLVEDNLVNQKVAGRLLERMGCRIVIANNGAEAVDACSKRRFALVLMDLQMPIMDGLEATRAIRAADSYDRRTPIVALSANAMPDQVAQCMTAGMDDFLSKPIDVARLREVVTMYVTAPGTLAETKSEASKRAPIDIDHLRRISDDDAEFTAELVALFMESSTAIISEIRAAHAQLDRNALARAAHKLKGASANVCAEVMRELSSQLEIGSLTLSSEALEASVGALAIEMVRMRDYLRESALLAA